MSLIVVQLVAIRPLPQWLDNLPPSAQLLMCMIRGISCGWFSSFAWQRLVHVSNTNKSTSCSTNSPEGTIMTMSRMMMPTIRHMRIFMSFHHICLRTRLAPLRKPWADTARLSVLSCSESRRAPRSETLLMLSRMMPTVLSIS
jgi:hypothetical protein